jgi:hypothetical protein
VSVRRCHTTSGCRGRAAGPAAFVRDREAATGALMYSQA